MTELDQCSFEAALRSDLASARQENGMLRDQLREANTLNEALSYKVDFLTAEVSRVTASREQYERIAIRVSTIGESVVKVAMGQLQSLLDEIRAAAFTQVPGAVKSEPVDDPIKGPASPDYDDQYQKAIDKLKRMDDKGRVIAVPAVGISQTPTGILKQIYRDGDSASLLPPARLGNGEGK